MLTDNALFEIGVLVARPDASFQPYEFAGGEYVFFYFTGFVHHGISRFSHIALHTQKAHPQSILEKRLRFAVRLYETIVTLKMQVVKCIPANL